MKLIEILVRELPGMGGWPEGSVECERFVDEATIDFYDIDGNWDDDCTLTYGAIALEIVRKPIESFEKETVTLAEYQSSLAAAKKKEWNGEGLPPVGCRIEYTCSYPDVGHPAIEAGKWYGGTVIAYYDECVWTSDNGIRHLCNTIFRPLRSEADKKRGAAVKAIEGAQCHVFETASGFAEFLYDAIAAGKIPGIKLE